MLTTWLCTFFIEAPLADPSRLLDSLHRLLESYLGQFRWKDTDQFTWLRLIYGNDPGELVSDWGIPHQDDFAKAVEKAVDEHYDRFTA